MKKKNTNLIRHSLLFVIALAIYASIIMFSFVVGYNFEYVNVTSTVNITNAFPRITEVVMDQNILLNAGTTKVVHCNASMYDWNGYADIIKVNATIWENITYTQAAGVNNNSNYFNTSCTQIANNSYYANYTCAFHVWYYANASTNWMCNVSVVDGYNYTHSLANTSTIQQYYALNVTPLIDYGNIAVGDTSENTTANITNFGNMAINISVNGTNMTCSLGNTKIPVQYQKYTASPSEDYAAKTALSTSLTNITGLIVPKRMTTLNWNITYWQVQAPVSENPAGRCNGTIVFTAVAG